MYDDSIIIDYYYMEIGYLEFIFNQCTGYVDNVFYDYVFSRIKWLRYKLNTLYHQALKFYKALNSRRNRLFKTLKSKAKNGDMLFITLTFSDDYINILESSLHYYVKTYLNSLDCYYVANKDYGEKYGRLHYHAVVCTDFIDLSKYCWKYGGIKIERVKNNKEDLSRLSFYILKFVNHSFKDSTNKYVMYSRKKRSKK